MEGQCSGASGMVDSGTTLGNHRRPVHSLVRHHAALAGLDSAGRRQIALSIVRPFQFRIVDRPVFVSSMVRKSVRHAGSKQVMVGRLLCVRRRLRIHRLA